MPDVAAKSFVRRHAVALAAVAAVLAAWAATMAELIDRRPPDVGYAATPPEVVAAMVELAGVRDGDVVYDLGCGDGRLALAAAARGPAVRALGIDRDRDLVDEARANAERAGLAGRVRFRRADLFREDLRPATVVMMYLSTDVNRRLRPQLEQLKPGARVVSHAYGIPGVTPTRVATVRTADGAEHRLLLWHAPLQPE